MKILPPETCYTNLLSAGVPAMPSATPLACSDSAKLQSYPSPDNFAQRCGTALLTESGKKCTGGGVYGGRLDLTANTIHTPTPHVCQLEQAVFWKHLDTTLAFVCTTGGSKQAPSLRCQHQKHSGSRMSLPAGGSGQGSGTASEEERVLLRCAGLPAWPRAARVACQDELGDRHTAG